MAHSRMRGRRTRADRPRTAPSGPFRHRCRTRSCPSPSSSRRCPCLWPAIAVAAMPVATAVTRPVVPAVATTPAAVAAVRPCDAAAVPAPRGAAAPSVGRSRRPSTTARRGPDRPSSHGALHRRAERRHRHYTPARRNQSSSASRVLRKRERVPGDLVAGEVARLAHLVGVRLGLEAVRHRDVVRDDHHGRVRYE